MLVNFVSKCLMHSCSTYKQDLSQKWWVHSVLTRIFYIGVHRTHREAKRGPRGRKAGHNKFLDTANSPFSLSILFYFSTVITCCHSIKFRFESLKPIFLELNSLEKGHFLYSWCLQTDNIIFLVFIIQYKLELLCFFPCSKCSYTSQPTEYQRGMP